MRGLALTDKIGVWRIAGLLAIALVATATMHGCGCDCAEADEPVAAYGDAFAVATDYRYTPIPEQHTPLSVVEARLAKASAAKARPAVAAAKPAVRRMAPQMVTYYETSPACSSGGCSATAYGWQPAYSSGWSSGWQPVSYGYGGWSSGPGYGSWSSGSCSSGRCR